MIRSVFKGHAQVLSQFHVGPVQFLVPIFPLAGRLPPPKSCELVQVMLFTFCCSLKDLDGYINSYSPKTPTSASKLAFDPQAPRIPPSSPGGHIWSPKTPTSSMWRNSWTRTRLAIVLALRLYGWPTARSQKACGQLALVQLAVHAMRCSDPLALGISKRESGELYFLGALLSSSL